MNYKPGSNPWVFFLSESTICDLHLRLCFSLTIQPESTWWLKAVWNSRSRGSDLLFQHMQAPSMHTVHKHTCKLKTHTHKIKMNKSWKWGCGKAILVMCWCPLILGLCLCWELRVRIQFLLLLCYLKMSLIRRFWSLVVSQEHKIPITQMDFLCLIYQGNIPSNLKCL